MSKCLAEIKDVWVDKQGLDGPAVPIVCLKVQILDEDICKKHPLKGKVVLTFSPWDYSFPSGSDIEACMIDFAKAWTCHKGNVIEVEDGSDGVDPQPEFYEDREKRLQFISDN